MTDNPINWIEEAIAKEHFKYYEYNHFNNIEEIGEGAFGKVCRANLKDSERYLALKSFSNFNNTTAKEVVRELKLQRQVGFHNNIRIYGITLEDENSLSKNYSLVMEYADGGTLKQYLKENFDNLTWNDKLSIADQLSCAVSCLHNEEIVHGDLHSGNILVYQNNIKLADFGLSKRIRETSNRFFGIVPYVDPKIFSRQRNNNDQRSPSLESDIYGVGVLLWEISSGRPPFDSEPYDIALAMAISQGLRETIIPDTPIGYSDLYMECWDNNPDNRPTIDEVINQLKRIMSGDNLDDSVRKQKRLNSNIDETKTSSFDYDKMIEDEEIEYSYTKVNEQQERPRSLLGNVVNFIDKLGENKLERNIYDYETGVNNRKTDELFQMAANLGNNLSRMYKSEEIIDKDEVKASINFDDYPELKRIEDKISGINLDEILEAGNEFMKNLKKHIDKTK